MHQPKAAREGFTIVCVCAVRPKDGYVGYVPIGSNDLRTLRRNWICHAAPWSRRSCPRLAAHSTQHIHQARTCVPQRLRARSLPAAGCARGRLNQVQERIPEGGYCGAWVAKSDTLKAFDESHDFNFQREILILIQVNNLELFLQYLLF